MTATNICYNFIGFRCSPYKYLYISSLLQVFLLLQRLLHLSTYTITPSLSVMCAHLFQKYRHHFLLYTSFRRSYLQPCATARCNLMISMAFIVSVTVVLPKFHHYG